MATSVRERTSSIKVSGSNPEGNIEMLANGTISCEKEEKKKKKTKKEVAAKSLFPKTFLEPFAND